MCSQSMSLFLFNAYFPHLKADILEMGSMLFNDLLNEIGMSGLKIRSS